VVTSIFDRLFVGLQRLVPARLLGRFVYRLSRSQRPWLKNSLIRGFIRMYPVDTREMDLGDPCEYSSFNAFFTRALRDGARPVDADPGAVCSPADGTVQQAGHIKEEQILQIKGMRYRLTDLLGIDAAEAAAFEGGAFLTVYLAPHNYHRVHMPLDGVIREMNHLPGKRLAVNSATVRTVPGLFAGNERLACRWQGQPGAYWVVFVGAMNVASISTAWAGEVLPGTDRDPVRRVYEGRSAVELKKGDYCGHFNLGSTVIVVLPADSVSWSEGVQPGAPVRVGQRVGSLAQ
jgi:phosphatidylserine decarboxylase